MKYEIEIEGLPGGWIAVAYRRPIMNVDYILLDGDVMLCDQDWLAEHLIIEKTRPRRIVLEETDEIAIPKNGDWVLRGKVFQQSDGNDFRSSHRIWREIIDETSTVKYGE